MKLKNILTGIAFMGMAAVTEADTTVKYHHFFGQTEKSYQNKIDYGNNIEAGHYIKSSDAKIYYEVYGNNKEKTIVLLHGGIVGSPEEMGQLADALKDEYQVILIATRGHARSEVGIAIPSYEQKADDVNVVLKDLNIAKADLLGFSDGAYTAYFFAEKYPQKVKHIIGVGAGVWRKGFVQGGRTAMKSFNDLKSMDERYWNEQLNGIRPEPENISEWFNSVIKYYNSVEVSDKIFRSIQAKTLLLAGEKDANAPLDTVIEAYHMIPNAQLGIIPDASHPVLQTDFPVVYYMIEKFLNGNE